MMETAHPRLRLNSAHSGLAWLDGPIARRLLLQSNVRAVFVIIRQILTPKPPEMAFVDRDDVIHHLAASTADPSFSDSVLPGAPYTRSHRFDTARLQELDDVIAELGVPIEQDIT